MKKLLCIVFTVATAMAGPSSLAQNVSTRDFSGYLDDYDKLVFSEDLNAFVFFNEDKRGKYSKVYFESLSIYTREAKASGEVALQSADYLQEGLTEIFRERGVLAIEPGPGVLTFNVALTAVSKTKEGLKPHNVIPVSALFRGAKEATGKVDTFIDVMFEAELTDSQTGERAAAIVRRGIGETEKKSGDDLSFEDVKPTLDLWLETYKGTIDAFLASR